MRLRSLELYGFKSFADRMRFDFEPGMTCIVGPNGCGKSNVTEAIRWVMGEQSVKSLRGGEMNDVIFAGTQRRKALGFAEVVVIFENEDRRLPVDKDEVSVGRRLYRTGESEYFINTELCRLKDVKDLLMDSGLGTSSYCFIQQGEIDKLLNANAKERRLVFEEAAGISKYRTRKAAALRKVERTERNVEYLNTIRQEVAKSYRRANRQAQAARRYKRHMDALREKQIVLALADFRALRDEKAKLDRELARLRQIEAAAAAEASAAEARVTEAEVEEIDLEKKAAEADELGSEAQMAAERLEAGQKSAESHADDLVRQIEAGEREVSDLSSQVDERREELLGLEESRKKLEADAAGGERSLEEAQAAAKEAAVRADDLASALRTWQEKAYATVRAQSEAQNELTRAESELRNLGHTVERLEKELARTGRAQEEARTKAEEAGARCVELRDGIGAAKSAAAAAREETAALERELARLGDLIAKQRGGVAAEKARLSFLLDLARRADGIAAGARGVINAVKGGAAEFGRTYGLVADLAKARPGFEAAIETAMGGLACDVVVDSGMTASKAIDFLTREQLGRAGFLPLDRMCRTALIPEELTKMDGVLGLGCDLLDYDRRFRHVFEYLLGRVLVVRDRKVALKMARLAGAGTRMVTLGGEIVDGTGPMTGGASRAARPGLLSRKVEIKRLKVSLSKGVKGLRALLAECERVEETRNAARSRADELAARAQETEGRLAGAEAELASLRKEENRLKERQLAAAAELDESKRDRQSAAREIDEVRSRCEELTAEQCAAEGKAESVAAEIDLARRERARCERELADERAEIATLREKLTGQRRQVENLRRQVEEREQSLRARRDEIERNAERVRELRRRAEEAKRELSSRSEELERLAGAAQGMRAKRDELRGELDSMRRAARAARTEHNQANSDLSELRVGESDVRLRLETLEERASSDYSVSLAERLAKYEEATACRQKRERFAAAVAAGLESGEDYVSELGLEAPGGGPEGEDEAQAQEQEIDFEHGIPEPTPELRAEIDELRRRIESLGNVNTFALEEAKELQARIKFLDEQYEDLTKARHSLKSVIAKINRKSRALFQETFDAVRANFQEIFRKLFGGGKADIFLEEGEDVLEAGIEIKARPPGREELPLSALSGGQKAMTTIALLFAIFRTKPSPFCILDEVDAPLDDLNVERYNLILEEYTDKTQFIVITHNKATMAHASLLYGVTMQEAGVSRKVSIRLADVDDVEAEVHSSAEREDEVLKRGNETQAKAA